MSRNELSNTTYFKLFLIILRFTQCKWTIPTTLYNIQTSILLSILHMV